MKYGTEYLFISIQS